MQSVPKKILQILDGTPAVYGQHSRGQSLVELALVTPLLIVLLMGLAEIGWFANNYLILLEATRVGARYGAIQTGQYSPLEWDNAASLFPELQSDWGQPSGTGWRYAQKFRVCPTKKDTQLFYSIVVCRMQDAIVPLVFNGDDPTTSDDLNDGNGVDDIVISAFSLQSIDPKDTNIPDAMRSTIDWVWTSGALKDQQQVLVVGRYPTNANECTTEVASPGVVLDTRDPFNYMSYTGAGNTKDGNRNYIIPAGVSDPSNEANWLFYEKEGYDTGEERQRGFVYTGQHVIQSTRGLAANKRCYGSEWTMDRVEQLMNGQSFSLADQSQRSTLPGQGMILVEMFWQHTLLLRNPVFNPVFNILNDPTNPNGGGTIISVWAAFPLPTTEPRIKYATGS